MNIYFVLSEKRLFNNNLKAICENCNGKPGLNLYSVL